MEQISGIGNSSSPQILEIGNETLDLVDKYKLYKHNSKQILLELYNRFKLENVVIILVFFMLLITVIHSVWYIYNNKEINTIVNKSTKIYNKRYWLYILFIILCIYSIYNKLFSKNKIYGDYVMMKKYNIDELSDIESYTPMYIHRHVIYICMICYLVGYIIISLRVEMPLIILANIVEFTKIIEYVNSDIYSINNKIN